METQLLIDVCAPYMGKLQEYNEKLYREEHGLFLYDELTQDAKQAACSWWLGAGGTDDDWPVYVKEHFAEVVAAFGVTINLEHCFLSSTHDRVDGAGIRGIYEHKKGWKKDFLKTYQHIVIGQKGKNIFTCDASKLPADTRQFVEEAQELDDIIRRFSKYTMYLGKITFSDTSRRYNTAGTAVCDVINYHAYYPHTASDAAYDCAEELIESLCNKLIRMANAEIDWLESEECIGENIRCNEYTFNADGERQD